MSCPLRTETRQTTLRETPSLYAQVALGIAPHYHQARWMDCLAPVKVGCMGRSFGKTFAESASSLWFADCHDETEQLIIAPTSDQTRTLMGYMERMIHEGSVHVQNRVDRILHSPFPEIQWRNGSRIHARSAGIDGQNIRSLHPDLVRHDEAAFIPSAVVTDVIPPMLAASRYKHRVYISTPFGKNHFFDLFTTGQAGSAHHVSFQLPSRLNPRISASWLAEQRAQMTALAYATEYEAQFADDQNAVFAHSLIQSCLCDELATEPQEGHRYVIGYDPAKWSDRSGVVVLDVTERPWRVAGVADISGRDYLIQAGEIAAYAARYHQAAVLMDATSHDQMLEHLRAQRITTEGFRFTNETKQELMNRLVLTMERGDLLIPHHADLIGELTYYRYELTKAGNVRLGADTKHHDDLVTALALAVWQAESGSGVLSARDPDHDRPVPDANPQTFSSFNQRLKRRR